MQPHVQAPATEDRISTREELDEVIDMLIRLQQLPSEATLQFLVDSDCQSDLESDALWTVSHREAGPPAQVEPLANFILGPQQRLN